ncbi:hypothetical protein DPEC_G00198290 [Dallia pectoralis]|uniref:Uncharacterized protein n=1 Tax=Dallia pectoralis TaxID=75939 RepID=A0ACC2G8F9_DALPE|nr:hypothetical protein DPEC_G00198290 [Dallia pectoralis]
MCNRGEEDLAWERVDHNGKKQLQTSADGWSSRRCVGTSRQQATLECRRIKVNALPSPSLHPSYAREFIREGTKTAKVQTTSDVGQLGRARDWKLVADLNQRLHFPSEIATTNLRPDLVLWSSSLHSVYIIELTVPWEAAVEEAFERKSLKYTELAADAEQRGWKA